MRRQASIGQAQETIDPAVFQAVENISRHRWVREAGKETLKIGAQEGRLGQGLLPSMQVRYPIHRPEAAEHGIQLEAKGSELQIPRLVRCHHHEHPEVLLAGGKTIDALRQINGFAVRGGILTSSTPEGRGKVCQRAYAQGP